MLPWWRRMPLVAAGMVALLALACGDAVDRDSSRETMIQRSRASASTRSITASPSVVASAQITVTAPVSIPADAAIQNEEQAITRALEAAYDLRAEDPRVVAVELMTLGAALSETHQDPAATEPVDLEADGDDELLESLAAWRVQLDGAEFAAESCPPPDGSTGEPGEGSVCPTYPTAIFVIAASSGEIISMSLGYPVPQ